MTAWGVITRVVIGVQISLSLSKGILHVKTWVIEVRNVKSGFNLGLKVVMTAKNMIQTGSDSAL